MLRIALRTVLVVIIYGIGDEKGGFIVAQDMYCL